MNTSSFIKTCLTTQVITFHSDGHGTPCGYLAPFAFTPARFFKKNENLQALILAYTHTINHEINTVDANDHTLMALDEDFASVVSDIAQKTGTGFTQFDVGNNQIITGTENVRDKYVLIVHTTLEIPHIDRIQRFVRDAGGTLIRYCYLFDSMELVANDKTRDDLFYQEYHLKTKPLITANDLIEFIGRYPQHLEDFRKKGSDIDYVGGRQVQQNVVPGDGHANMLSVILNYREYSLKPAQ